MIAVNWGTTNFRAYRLNTEGTVLERRTTPQGILSIDREAFADALIAQTGDWIAAGETHFLLSGMVGSRQGWKETGYVRCPAGIEELIGGLVQVEFSAAEVFIVPGMICSDTEGVPDVMRGEETEILGALNQHLEPHLDQHHQVDLVCLPGTHSKWAHVEGGKTHGFTTYMTGEIFAALSRHTIFARQIVPGDSSMDAFSQGVARSKESGGLLHHLFGARSRVLTQIMRPEETSSYLSGMLIGHEVGSAIQEACHVQLVGAEPLCLLYAAAIGLHGGTSSIIGEDAAARGLAAIGRRLSWI